MNSAVGRNCVAFFNNNKYIHLLAVYVHAHWSLAAISVQHFSDSLLLAISGRSSSRRRTQI